jgi:hypothetical protein
MADELMQNNKLNRNAFFIILSTVLQNKRTQFTIYPATLANIAPELYFCCKQNKALFL